MITKYRVWDKKDSRWVSTNVVVDASGILIWTLGFSIRLIDDIERYDVQHFTGLKDKAGIEVCEGDILETKYESMPDHKSTSQIVWICDEHEVGFNLIPGRPYSYVGFGEEKLKDMKVIGNIHENPELLKE